MRIVDKYELAECPKFTPFYKLKNQEIKDGVKYYKDGGALLSPLMVLDTFKWVSNNGKSMFTGVTYLEIDNWDEENNKKLDFTQETLPQTIDFVNIDTNSNDYTNEDKFLVLNSKEFQQMIEILQKYCYALEIYEKIENNNKENKK